MCSSDLFGVRAGSNSLVIVTQWNSQSTSCSGAWQGGPYLDNLVTLFIRLTLASSFLGQVKAELSARLTKSESQAKVMLEGY